MFAIEKITRVAFGVLFGWVVLLLAAETFWRRRRAAQRRETAERALHEHPRLRPTVAFGALEWSGEQAPPSVPAQTR